MSSPEKQQPESRDADSGEETQSEIRTDLADQRTVLANERTFAGWSRTAFASIALGLGFQALFRAIDPTWVAKSIASLFVLLGVAIIWIAEHRAKSLVEGKESELMVDCRFFRLLALSITLGSLVLLVALWILM